MNGPIARTDRRRATHQVPGAALADGLIACLLATYDVYGLGAAWPDCLATEGGRCASAGGA
jgi:hypothetical protein